MKGKSNRFVRTILTAILSLAMVFTTIPLTAFTALADDATPAAATEGVPTTTKTVTPNGDGTYNIKIGVKGAQVTSQNITKANVVVVMDTSGSMGYDQYGRQTRDKTQTRLYAAKNAVGSVANTLLAYNEKIQGVTNVVQMALIGFSDSAYSTDAENRSSTFDNDDNSWYYLTRTWWGTSRTKTTPAIYTDYESMSSAVNDLKADGGTNWETALQAAENVNFGDSDPTYVIFVSDGDPTEDNTSGDGTYYHEKFYNSAVTKASDLVNSKGYKLYAIGAYGNVSRMQSLVTATGEDSSSYYDASSTDALNSALSKIAQAISNTLGDSNVKVNDGVTDLAAITAKTGEPTSGFTYTQTDSTGTESAWDGAPAASYANGTVTWDLSSVGALDPNTTYSVSFDVWPGQGAYDLVADLNNGVETYDNLTDAEKAQITATPNSDGTTSYTLKTNSSLVTSYTYNENNLTDTPSYTNGEMDVQSAKLNLTKKWVNDLDSESTPAVTLTVTKDGVAYISKDLSADNNWTDTVSLAPGLIKGSDVLVAGHDYTVTEKTTGSETSDYHWELSAATYHPMVIDGTLKMLQLTDQASAQYTINNQYYKVADDQATLTATNTRRSNLNLTKKVEGTDPNADKALFTYNVTVTDPTGSDIWLSVMDAEGKLVSGANLTTSAEAQTDGYYKVASGTAFTVAMKAGWNLRVLNLPTGSTYSMEETAMPDGYHFVSAASTTPTNAVSGQTVTGTIDAPDNSYTVTYTNQYDGFFYVYHTSNNTIEAVSMTPYVTDTAATYDLAARTATGTYYGGYYNGYKSKGTVITKGSECSVTGSYAPYKGELLGFYKAYAKAYTESGHAMHPVEGTVYYIKEVPAAYLDSKIYVSYYEYAIKDADGTVTGYNTPLSKIQAISAIDDKNYTDVGFYVNDVKTSVGVTKMVNSVKVTKGSKSESYSAKKLFNSLTRGYLETTAISTEAGDYTATPYWITPDNVEVKSTVTRTVSVGSTADKTSVDGVVVYQ
ncbi:MAG: VWA domain-containing protein [Chordicoccus sp.]